MLCFVPVLHGCVWYVCCYVRKNALLQCLQLLLGFGIGTMLANFHVLGIMFLLRAVLNILVRNASPRGPMSFRGLIFNLSGPFEL